MLFRLKVPSHFASRQQQLHSKSKFPLMQKLEPYRQQGSLCYGVLRTKHLVLRPPSHVD